MASLGRLAQGAVMFGTVTACRVGASPDSTRTSRDSAGIQIVENAGPRWAEGEGWPLSPEPTLSLGVFEGDSTLQFNRIVGAVRLTDGRIVVANGGSSELRFFDAGGAFIRSAGRKGSGPGEFEGLQRFLRLGGDSLLTWDFRNRRFSVFGPDGDFVRSFSIQAPAMPAGAAPGGMIIQSSPMPSYVGVLDQTHLLASFGTAGPPEPIKLFRDSVVLSRLSVTGSIMDTLGRFPWGETYHEVVATEHERTTFFFQREFGRQAQQAVGPGGFYFGSSDSYEIGFYTGDGRLSRIIRVNRPNRPLPAEAVERLMAERRAAAKTENARRRQERLALQSPFPDTLPAYGAFIVDEAGHLWVAESRLPGDTLPRWQVFDAEGVLLGAVATPRQLTIRQIGSDFVLGVWRDENDIEYVRMYALKKG